ncbi:MMPL family transporter [Glutamicibacter sp. JL.03c]|uniref:MMPL family transporter n=1 Tax=Glutamicibacter sp. JL.03c TaxID=2984842 RepID=UPI0021F6A8B9|nr:MMPL family transporter [Glutamicibacter sp. JL.03c]UYQ76164.1 MMPL family transporter [Glutamicibacter sp. JL.03c]
MKVSVIPRVARSLTSGRGARIWIAAIIAVIAIVFGSLSSLEPPARSDSSIVNGSDSAHVQEILDENSTDSTTSALLVASKPDHSALSNQDKTALEGLAAGLSAGAHVTDGRLLISEDEQAAMLPVSWSTVSNEGDRQTLEDLRNWINGHPIQGLDLQVTGATAFAVDITGAFVGADFTLLAVTVGIVALLLILTYRSPVLWLLPLAIVAIADRSASLIANLIGNLWGLSFDSGVLSVLVFGAGTNYALLLISRYRDELRAEGDHRQALANAWISSFEAILTSNLTVVLALLTLGLAVMEDTRGLGIVCAAGLLIAAFFVLFLLPPVLAISGRKAFWPLVPRPGSVIKKQDFFGRAARMVMQRPGLNLAAMIALLLVLAGPLAGTRIGLPQVQQFRTATESSSAMEQLSAHFPAGEAQPITVLADPDQLDALGSQLAGVDDVKRVGPVREVGNSDWLQFSVVPAIDPDSSQAQDLVAELRTVAGKDGQVLIGGPTAQQLDSRQMHLRDLYVIAPLIMFICFAMLAWLTRSWRTALALGLVNLLSAAAAAGLGSLVSSLVFDATALDVQVPLLAFVFLVALGVDYTIFITHRVRQDVQNHELHAAIEQAASRTGSVITSAGLVLAGVFAALATLPLTVLGQLGLIVGLGVLLDTFVVRTLLLPALLHALGTSGRPLFGGISRDAKHASEPTTPKESEIHA